MTNIINVDLEKIIESSISELTKNLSSKLNKKVREDVINNLMMNITTKSIYGLDDIKDFGKFNSHYSFIQCPTTFNYIQGVSFKRIQEFKENEYPILYTHVNTNGGENYYISNIIDGLLLSNDDILFLSLFSIKLSKPYIDFNLKPFPQFIDYLVQNNYIESDYHILPKHRFEHNEKLDNSLRRYFASVHDNKIKAFEFDKLLKKYKELEVSIDNNKKEFDKLKDLQIMVKDENGYLFKEIEDLKKFKIIKTNTELEINKQQKIIIELENKNKNLEEEIIKQSKKLKEIKEIEILNLEEEYNKLFTVFTETKDELNKTKEENNKTKEENIKLSDEWLILKDKTIAKFEEDNYKLRMEKDKLIKKIAELEKKTE